MKIKSRIYSESMTGRTVWFWQVWDADNTLAPDGTPLMYGFGACETREEAEAQAEARLAEGPARDAARRAVGN